MATLIVRRPNRFNSFFRKINIFVNGDKIGNVSNNSEVTLTIDEIGPIKVHAKIDWVKSKILEFDVSTDSEITLFCEPSHNHVELMEVES